MTRSEKHSNLQCGYAWSWAVQSTWQRVSKQQTCVNIEHVALHMRLIVQSMTTPCCSGGATSKRLVAHGGSASRWTRGTGLGSMSKPLTDPSFPSPHGQREWFMLSLNVSDHDIMITTWWACQCGVWMRLCLWLGLPALSLIISPWCWQRLLLIKNWLFLLFLLFVRVSTLIPKALKTHVGVNLSDCNFDFESGRCNKIYKI